jgi:hypothetical protein
MNSLPELFSEPAYSDDGTVVGDVALPKPVGRQEKAFDASKHPRGQPANKGEFAAKGTAQPAAAPAQAARPQLTDEQIEHLKELQRLFPEGVGHLLTPEGKVHPDHLVSEDDRQANAEAEEHVAGWHAAAKKIDTHHGENDAAERTVKEDEQINNDLNELPQAEVFGEHATNVESDETSSQDAVDAMNEIVGAIDTIEQSTLPDYPDRPDPEDYKLDPADLDEEFDEPGDRRDHVETLHGEHKDNAEQFAEDSETYREEVAEASAGFRDEQRNYLEILRDTVANALKVPEKEWGSDPHIAKHLRGEVSKLGEQADAILKKLGPAG